MKARLIYFQDQYQLLVSNGQIIMKSLNEARGFLLSYSNPEHYADEGTWDYEIALEEYGGDSTVAYIDDDGNLVVTNPVQFYNILEGNTVYLTAAEYAAMHGKHAAIIRRFCLQDRLPGAILKGRTWLIPENCPYPEKER